MIVKGILAWLVAALFSIDALQGQIFTARYLIEIGYSALLCPVLFGLLGIAPWLQPDRRRGGVMQ
jgi:hypothetical protein